MQSVKVTLLKRKKIAIYVLAVIFLLSLIVQRCCALEPPSYIPKRWHMPLVYALIIYKIVELWLFYIFLYKKPYLKSIDRRFDTDLLRRFAKKAKTFLYLVPQGSVVFGVLSYKLSANPLFLWLFLAMALFVLLVYDRGKLSKEEI